MIVETVGGFISPKVFLARNCKLAENLDALENNLVWDG